MVVRLTGREVDQLVASAALEFAPGVVSRLLAGDSSRVTLQLHQADRKSKVQLAGGLGGQVLEHLNRTGTIAGSATADLVWEQQEPGRCLAAAAWTQQKSLAVWLCKYLLGKGLLGCVCVCVCFECC
jgi:hypothetical protein